MTAPVIDPEAHRIVARHPVRVDDGRPVRGGIIAEVPPERQPVTVGVDGRTLEGQILIHRRRTLRDGDGRLRRRTVLGDIHDNLGDVGDRWGNGAADGDIHRALAHRPIVLDECGGEDVLTRIYIQFLGYGHRLGLIPLIMSPFQ